MPFAAVTGPRWRARGKRAIGATLTLVMLSAVAVVGLALLDSDVLASGKVPGNTEQALASSSAFEGLLTFEAPASTVSRLEATTKEAQKDKDLTRNAPLLVKNWKYTQSSLADLVQLSLNLYVQGIALQLVEQFLDSLGPLVNQGLVDQIFTAAYRAVMGLQEFVNVFIPAPIRGPPPPTTDS
jgi:hypothetical protein